MVKARQSRGAISGRPWRERGGREKEVGVMAGAERKTEVKGKTQSNQESHKRGKKTFAVDSAAAMNCCVLLTRLDEKGFKGHDAPGAGRYNSSDVRQKQCSGSPKGRTKGGGSGMTRNSVADRQTAEPKTGQSDASLAWPAPDFEPRKRRMASLNAEAVNSLLLYRADFCPSNIQKKQLPSKGDPGKDGLPQSGNADRETKKVTAGTNADPKQRAKRSAEQTPSVDWLSLFAPTPRRQAGLTAATLLKLTSSLYGTKRQKKQNPKPAGENKAEDVTPAAESGGGRARGGSAQARRSTPPEETQVKRRTQGIEDPVHSQRGAAGQGCCGSCETQVSDPDVKCASGGQECLKRLHRGSALGFPLKTIKEEQVETEVSSCYCCSRERCVEYCHRLSLFLKDKALKEPDDNGSLSEVFHHHHHHHHHHHLQPAHPAAAAISPHTYTCFPSYCVHFGQPDSPSSIPPLTLCPRSSKTPKLLLRSGLQPSGISHSVYCCASVEACYGEPCRINGYSAYTSVIPTIGRGGCSFRPTDCAKCSRGAERDKFSSALSDHHGPTSISICPSPRILTGCPISTVPPAGQSVPQLQTPLSDPSQPQPPPQVAKECPQSAKPPSGSRSGARGTGRFSSTVFPLNREKKQRLCSAGVGGQTFARQPKISRQKTTNGWQPVGVPFQKEVFCLGEEAPALRKCFEGVQRDGELIQVRDTVLLKSGPRKKSLPYVAKISALWEEPESGELMMSLFWYYRPEHTQGGRNPSLHCENEIFASRHQDVNSVACIEDKCHVLTLAQYCRFCALVRRRQEGICYSAASLVVPAAVDGAAHRHYVSDDIDPELVFLCRHVYDFRYGRLLKNLQ